MKHEVLYPWCTGCPRPVLVSCADTGRHSLSYYVAPIVSQHGTAQIDFECVTSFSHVVINDSENSFLLEDILLHDSITEIQGDIFVFFHNEYFRITGKISGQHFGKLHNSENIATFSLDRKMETM